MAPSQARIPADTNKEASMSVDQQTWRRVARTGLTGLDRDKVCPGNFVYSPYNGDGTGKGVTFLLDMEAMNCIAGTRPLPRVPGATCCPTATYSTWPRRSRPTPAPCPPPISSAAGWWNWTGTATSCGSTSIRPSITMPVAPSRAGQYS